MPVITDQLSGALFCAKRGLKVFPVRHGAKTPLFEGWQDAATNDEATVRRLAAEYPECNWGVFCGASGVLAIDLDVKKGGTGIIDWDLLCETYGMAPRTLSVQTPSGGRHLLFWGRGPSTAKKLAPGVDTRGVGGYIVAPGSYLMDHSTGEILGDYTLTDDAPLAPCPAWVLSTLGERKAPLARPEDEAVAGSIPDGERHSALCRWAGALRGQGLVAEELAAALHALNRLRCSPPSPDDEVEKIARDIGAKPRGDAKEVAAFLAQPAEPAAAPVTERASRFAAMEPPPHDPILEGVFDRGTGVIFAGKSKSRKSFFALQLLMSISSGSNFGPYKTRQVPCLLVDTELSLASIHRRVHAMAIMLGLPVQALNDLHILALKDSSIPRALAAERISDVAKSVGAKVVTIDSLYSFSNGREDGEDALEMVKMLREIRRTAGVCTIVTRHDGKGLHADKEVIDRGAGHSTLARDADALCAIDVGEEPGTYLLRWSARDYPEPESWSCEWSKGAMLTTGLPVVPKKVGSGPGFAEISAKVLTMLDGEGSAPVGEFIQRVQDEVGVGERKARAALGKLVKGGQVERLTTSDFPKKEIFKLSTAPCGGSVGKCGHADTAKTVRTVAP